MGWASIVAIAATLVACVTAVIGLIIQAIRSSSPAEYHPRNTCMCYECRMARYRAMRRKGLMPLSTREDGSVVWSDEVPMEVSGNLTTLELKPWMKVEVFGKEYRIEAVDQKSDGYRVFMRNLETRGRFYVTIAYGAEHRRYWKPRGWSK